jgi:hypothetical protein
VGRLTALLALAAAFAAGATASAQDGTPMSYTTVDTGSAWRYAARTTLVIRDKRRWRRVWTRLQNTIPQPRRPRVDFRRTTVIAVLRGSGTGTGLRIEGVTRKGGALVVRVQETRAGDGCIVPQSVENRYEVIEVPRTTGPVRTERVERVLDCS